MGDLQMGGILPGMGIGGVWNDNDPCIWISNLPKDTTEEDIYELFAPFGAIPPKGIRLQKSKETGVFSGMCNCNYLDSMSAQNAIASMNGMSLRDGGTLRVDWNRKPAGAPAAASAAAAPAP